MYLDGCPCSLALSALARVLRARIAEMPCSCIAYAHTYIYIYIYNTYVFLHRRSRTRLQLLQRQQHEHLLRTEFACMVHCSLFAYVSVRTAVPIRSRSINFYQFPSMLPYEFSPKPACAASAVEKSSQLACPRSFGTTTYVPIPRQVPSRVSLLVLIARPPCVYHVCPYVRTCVRMYMCTYVCMRRLSLCFLPGLLVYIRTCILLANDWFAR